MMAASLATTRKSAERARLLMEAEQARYRTDVLRARRKLLKQRTKALATYDGAKKDRRDKDWNPRAATADAAIIPDAGTLLARARGLVRDNAHARSIVRGYARNVVGRGITPTPGARRKSGRDITGFNDGMADLFERWAGNPDWCDVEGRKTFWQMQSMATEQLIEAGEVLIIIERHDNGDRVPPLRLRFVEPEHFDTTKTRNEANNNEIRGGVEVDGDGRAVAYHLFEVAPGEFIPTIRRVPFKSVRVPASQCIHLFQQERPGQTRGVTMFAPVIRKLRDLSEYDSMELFNARQQAIFGITVEREDIEQDRKIGLVPEAGETEQDSRGNQEVNWEPGMVFEGSPGDKIRFFKPEVPAERYEPFTMAQLRSISAGVGLSYEQVARDFHNGNFSSQRQALLEDRREWRKLQDFLIYRFCKPVWDRFVFFAVVGQFIDAPAGFFDDPNRFCVCDWQPDGWEWVDPAKEAAAKKIALEMQLDDRERILNEQGRGLREFYQRKQRERDIAEEFGFTLPELSGGGVGVSPSEPRPDGVAPEGRGDDGLAEDEPAREEQEAEA